MDSVFIVEGVYCVLKFFFHIFLVEKMKLINYTPWADSDI